MAQQSVGTKALQKARASATVRAMLDVGSQRESCRWVVAVFQSVEVHLTFDRQSAVFLNMQGHLALFRPRFEKYF